MQGPAAKKTDGDAGLPDWALDVFKAVDDGDIDRFMGHMAHDVGFGFDGKVMARGKDAVRAMVDSYLSGFDSLAHHFEGAATQGDITFVRGRVDYVIEGKGVANAGWTVCFHLKDGLIEEYLIYMDPVPLMRLQGRLPD